MITDTSYTARHQFFLPNTEFTTMNHGTDLCIRTTDVQEDDLPLDQLFSHLSWRSFLSPRRLARRLLYLGQRLGVPANGPGPAKMTTHDGLELHGWVVGTNRPRALVVFGGNNARVSDMQFLFEHEAFSGYAVYLFPYRGFEGQAGTPRETDLVDDGARLVAMAGEAHPAGVTVCGVSLGTGVATQVAALGGVDRMILVAPYDSIKHVARRHFPFLPVSWLLPDPWKSAKAARHVSCPTLVVRAAHDMIVPSACTDRLVAALGGSVEELTAFCGHSGMWEEPVWPTVRRAVARFLGTGDK